MPDVRLAAPTTPLARAGPVGELVPRRSQRSSDGGSGPGVELREVRVDEKPPPWAAMLGHFYARLGLPLPPMTRLEADELPQPQRQLLAHNRDMTPTLEQWHGGRLSLRVCTREQSQQRYLREVVLTLTGHGTPVEYGVICVYLGQFSHRARRLVLAEEHPFGRILELEGIAHLSWPQAYFKLTPDGHIRRLLGMAHEATLYGRRNVLLNGQRRLLAEVMEILAL